MLNYNHLHYFHVAATEGSLVKASAKLGVTASTVSEQLRALERATRKTLFERSTAGLRLTAAGQTVYEHTTAIFRSGERLEQVLADKPDDAPMSLRVGTSGAVARATSTDFLVPLFALDGCTPVIRIGDTVDLLRDLRGNELDLVLCETEPAKAALDGLQHAVIDRIPLVAIVAVDRKFRPDWEDLGLIQYRTSSNFYWEVARFLEAQNLRPEIVGEADDPFLMVEAVAHGGHVAIVPTSVARDAILTGRVRVLNKLDSAHAGVHALYQDGSAAEVVHHAIERLIAATTS
ncbi:MAG: LysR family transcriptional regulator [Deltaproteobacteria bacterium]|nr:LysR family transcriptional regulator [Deltaproteobacteria bacterium]